MSQPPPPGAPRPTLFIMAVVALALSGCASGSGSGEEGWSRTFSASFDEVWAAAIEVLEDSDFEIFERDRERGRLRAESHETVLELHLVERTELVQVDVMAGGPSQVPSAMGRLDVIVTTTLHEIARILREGS